MTKGRLAVVVFACLTLIASEALALPRFAAKAERPCTFCHVNPTGCWMRNTYGSQYYALTEMPVHKSSPDEIAKFQPLISDNIQMGLDMRMLYFYNKVKRDSTEIVHSSFFQMEGNLYVNAQLNDQYSAALYKDLFGAYQIFGEAKVLPYDGYVRVGQFQPSYGWRFADHSSFVRDSTVWKITYTDAGIEMGMYPPGFSFNVGIFNGSSGLLDSDIGKAVAARLEARKHVGPIGLGAGGSVWRNDIPGAGLSMYGPFYYLNALSGKVVYLGEVDWLKYKHPDSTVLATTHNVSCLLAPGLWLEATYDFFDPNTKIKSGAVARYGAGIDYFPFGFVEVMPVIRFYDVTTAPKNHYWDFHTEFHFFF